MSVLEAALVSTEKLANPGVNPIRTSSFSWGAGSVGYWTDWSFDDIVLSLCDHHRLGGWSDAACMTWFSGWHPQPHWCGSTVGPAFPAIRIVSLPLLSLGIWVKFGHCSWFFGLMPSALLKQDHCWLSPSSWGDRVSPLPIPRACTVADSSVSHLLTVSLLLYCYIASLYTPPLNYKPYSSSHQKEKERIQTYILEQQQTPPLLRTTYSYTPLR